jgi:hypothetical protein
MSPNKQKFYTCIYSGKEQYLYENPKTTAITPSPPP